MIDIVKGILDGGWALLVGWLFPSALTVLFFGFVVYPSTEDVSLFNKLSSTTAILTAAVVLGIVLSALQTPLYRFLEGYSWPHWAYKIGHRRQVQRRLRLKHTVAFAGYSQAERELVAIQKRRREAQPSGEDSLKAAEAKAVANYETWKSSGREAAHWLSALWGNRSRAERRLAKVARLPQLRRQILADRLERYPTDDDQILPTKLGNAIRRFERFGPEHYGLDQQRLWYELTGLAPEGSANRSVRRAPQSTSLSV
jgi:hypothetical protein